MQMLKKTSTFLNKELFSMSKRFIMVGEKIPSHPIKVVAYKDGEYTVTDAKTDEISNGKKIVIVGFPGAFTPVCERQLKEYFEFSSEVRKKGVSEIYAMSVNDPFVVKEFAKVKDAKDRIKWIADGNGDLTKALDVMIDLGKGHLGKRTRRFSMIVDNGKVTEFNDEKSADLTELSKVSTILKQI